MTDADAEVEVERRARAHVERDEARITGPRRVNQPLGAVFRAFWRHPSPYLLSTCLAAAILGRVLAGPGSPWELVIPVILVGLVPLVEWTVHVGILHWRPRRVGPVRVDPLLARKHRAHHADPRAIPLVFVPWQSQLWLAPSFLGLAWLTAPTWPARFTMLVAIYVLLSAYEWTHYLLHSDYRPRSRWYRTVWRNHRLHHYKNEHYWFAVTTAGTADRLFGTYPDPAAVPTSPTVRRLHAASADE